MMKKYTFDAKNGLWYEQCREYQLSCLTVPNSKPIGIGGQRHRRYLRQHKYGTYTALLLTGRLDDYLANIDWQAEEIFARLVEQLAETNGINEELKADNQMEWVRRMNAIFEQAREIVCTELKDAAGISFNVLEKMGKNEFVSMESLHKICLTLKCDVGDIMEFVDEGVSKQS